MQGKQSNADKFGSQECKQKDVNPLKHSVSCAATLTQNSKLLKYIPKISNEFFTFVIFLQVAFTVLGIGLFFNSGRIPA